MSTKFNVDNTRFVRRRLKVLQKFKMFSSLKTRPISLKKDVLNRYKPGSVVILSFHFANKNRITKFNEISLLREILRYYNCLDSILELVAHEISHPCKASGHVRLFC